MKKKVLPWNDWLKFLNKEAEPYLNLSLFLWAQSLLFGVPWKFVAVIAFSLILMFFFNLHKSNIELDKRTIPKNITTISSLAYPSVYWLNIYSLLGLFFYNMSPHFKGALVSAFTLIG